MLLCSSVAVGPLNKQYKEELQKKTDNPKKKGAAQVNTSYLAAAAAAATAAGATAAGWLA